MKTVERECLKVAEDLLGDLGCEITTRHGRHLRVAVRAPNGKEGHLTITSTPRADLKCQTNFTRQKVHRLIRELMAA